MHLIINTYMCIENLLSRGFPDGPWLRLCVSNAGDLSSIPGWETKILQTSKRGQKRKNQGNKLKFKQSRKTIFSPDLLSYN